MSESVLDTLKNLSVSVGTDALLVQGAGGNVSWKHDGILTIKASGTCLADAWAKDIFVDLTLEPLLKHILGGGSDFSQFVLRSPLRPSIETPLHALFPQKFVLHIHSVAVLSFAVLIEGHSYFTKYFQGLNWDWIPYYQPGSELANAVVAALRKNNTLDVLVLQNHGLVVAAESISAIEELLRTCLEKLPGPQIKSSNYPAPKLPLEIASKGYRLPDDVSLHALAYEKELFRLCHDHWALYPDHVVFLGPEPGFWTGKEIRSSGNFPLTEPIVVILPSEGVVLKLGNDIYEIMLRCFCQVCSNIVNKSEITSLDTVQVKKLLNWDAEKYRQKLQKN